MNKKPVFGLCGAAGSGKDSVANHLNAHFGVARFGFSWLLKDLCCSLFGWDRSRIDDFDYKAEVAPVRYIPREEAVLICREQFSFVRPVSAERALVDRVMGGLNVPHCGATTFGEKPWTRRKVLQHVGTEVFRAIDPDHWTSKAIRFIGDMLKDEIAVAVVDVRFVNEAAALKHAFGATIVRLERSDEAPSEDKHVSEQEFHEIPVEWVLSAPFGQLPRLYEQANSLARLSGLQEKS